MKKRRLLVAVAILFLSANAFAEEWYEAYQKGIDAAKKEAWDLVIQKMNDALAKKSDEGRHKSYGTIFVKYYPYYYRGVAYYKKGEWDKAINDLERTKGVGDLQLGSAESLIGTAQVRLASVQRPPVEPTPTPTVPTRPEPIRPEPEAVPAIDPAVRRSAEQVIARADVLANRARQEKADTYAAADFRQATQRLLDARRKAADADTTADWRAVEDLADKAALGFDSSISVARIAIADQKSRPEGATGAVLEPIHDRLKEALQAYYEGDFRVAASKLEKITKEQKNNAMLWAFLGAAHFYAYYLDGSETSREEAEKAFRRAKGLKRNLTLSENWFAPRVRNFYRTVSTSG